MTADLFAAAAVAISLVSFVVNFWAARAADRRGRMPVLVMERPTADERGNRILLKNVGNGPALNIIFGLAEEVEGAGSRQLSKGVRERWFSPLHLHPISPGKELDVVHPETSNVVGAAYTDALGNKYTVKASQYGTVVLEGRHLPEVWTIDNVPSMWEKPPSV